MARYIDADVLCKHFKILYEHAQTNGMYNHAKLYDRAFRVVVDAPTEDVVPRAEVEQIFEELFENADLLYDGYRDIIVLTEKDFAQLKNKYIGEQNNDR